MRKPYVTATEYGVSYLSGTDITGVLLNVYRSVSCDPHEATHKGNCTKLEYAVKDMPFANGDEADAYALANGWIKEYTHKFTERPASSQNEK